MTNQIDSSATMDQSEVLTPVPRVTLQAFCETHDVAAALQASLLDRRLAKAQGKIQMGGVTAAVETFRENPTPNIIVIENIADSAALIGHLEQLAEVVDAGTKVMIVGHVNDVPLYRELTRRGISDYLITPLDPLSLVRALCDLYAAPGASRVGRTIAFVGAKGGTGASTICHNVGWAISRQLESSTVIVDLDVAFGTAGLDFNQDPPQGIAEALFAPDRLDTNMLDRLLSRCSDNLLLLAAPAVLDRPCDFGEEALDQLLELLRHSAPSIVLDMPHGWQGWQRRTLMAADEVAIVATPDLASLRNAKNMVDLLRQNRPNDADPKLILNQTGIPKRPEITEQEFAKALKLDVTAVIPFDAPLFGTASNNGQMIAEVQPSGKTAEQLVAIATALTGRGEGRRPRRSFLDPIMARFKRNKAS
jgi:pilus assembly protein CpaE